MSKPPERDPFATNTKFAIRPVEARPGPWPTEEGERVHWSKLFNVHPAAAVFPMLPDDELNELAEDIKKNGLRVLPVFWESKDGTTYLLDGRNRLEASVRADIQLPWLAGSTWALANARTLDSEEDPVAFIISVNIRRRHLTKQQQADLIVASRMAETDPAKMARSVPRDETGHVKGSSKDPAKEKVIADCETAGIAKRTAERSLAKAKPKTRAKTDVKAAVKPKPSPKGERKLSSEDAAAIIDAAIREEPTDLQDERDLQANGAQSEGNDDHEDDRRSALKCLADAETLFPGAKVLVRAITDLLVEMRRPVAKRGLGLSAIYGGRTSRRRRLPSPRR